jgi:hypothetical protein
MNDLVMDECLYVKRSKGSFGGGNTAREKVLETFWFPCGVEAGYVELLLVMDNLESIVMIRERVSVERFREEYSEVENSRDAYKKLKEIVSCQSTDKR